MKKVMLAGEVAPEIKDAKSLFARQPFHELAEAGRAALHALAGHNFVVLALLARATEYSAEHAWRHCAPL